MGQKKLLRFNQIRSFSNVYEYPKDMQGQWNKTFGNDYPIILELACGRGEYTVGLAKMFTEQNFIGVDVKGNRMYIGAKRALEHPLPNVRFLRTQIEMITDYFQAGEVDEIWLTFPDPQLRTSRAKKRLTHPRFLRLYQKVLKHGGIIHLKTDSSDLYHFTLKVAEMYGLIINEQCDNVYDQTKIDSRLLIKTHYESLDIAQSNRIHYISFALPEKIADKDEELQEILKQTEKREES